MKREARNEEVLRRVRAGQEHYPAVEQPARNLAARFYERGAVL